MKFSYLFLAIILICSPLLLFAQEYDSHDYITISGASVRIPDSNIQIDTLRVHFPVSDIIHLDMSHLFLKEEYADKIEDETEVTQHSLRDSIIEIIIVFASGIASIVLLLSWAFTFVFNNRNAKDQGKPNKKFATISIMMYFIIYLALLLKMSIKDDLSFDLAIGITSGIVSAAMFSYIHQLYVIATKKDVEDSTFSQIDSKEK